MNSVFAAFRLISRLNFHLPIVIVFMSFFVDDVLTIAILAAIYTLCSALTIALFSGRGFDAKWMVLLGEWSKVAGLGWLIAMRDLNALFIFQVLSGVGHGLSISGESQLANRINSGGMARSQTVTFVQVYLSFAFTGIAGVFLFLEQAIYPFMASLVASFTSFLLVASLQPDPGAASAQARAKPAPLTINLPVLLTAAEFIFLRAIPLGVFVFFMPVKLFFVMNLDIYWISAFLILFTLSGAVTGILVGRFFKYFHNPLIQVVFLAGHAGAAAVMLLSQDVIYLLAAALYLGGSSAVSRPQAAYRVENSVEGADKSLTFRYVNFFELLCSGFIAVTVMLLALYTITAFGPTMSGIRALGAGG